MEFETQKIISARPQLPKANMFCHRRILHCAEVFYVAVVLWYAFSILATCQPCSVTASSDHMNCDACSSYRDDLSTGIQDVSSGDVTSGLASQNLVTKGSLDNVCPDSSLFCFRSTLPGFLSPEQDPISASEVSGVQSNVALHARSNQVRTNVSWSSNCGIFRFSSGRTVSCSLYDQKGCLELPCHHTKSETRKDVSSCRKPALNHAARPLTLNDDEGTRKSRILADFLPHVEISPSFLDWGQKYLHFPSSAFLTIRNTHTDNILTVHEPYSTSSQFYPCNCGEVLLAPGEIASICFVFLPTLLGLSSAQLVLQTSSGGFLVSASGFALESPYGIQPLMGLDLASSGKWRKNFSLFNPFSEALQVEEVTAWISVSSGNTSQLTKAICSLSSDKDQGEFSLPSVKEWIYVKSSEPDLPIISMKPHGNWEVGPQENETIMELDFPFHAKAKIFGAFCMRLLRSSKEKTDTIIVPLEVELGETSAFDDLPTPVSVSLEVLVPCEIGGITVFSLSLRNDAPYMLSVVNISAEGENTNHFHIKSMKGLVIFPGTITLVAVVFYAPLAFEMDGPPPEYPEMDINCELVVLTNDSSNSQVKIPCRDVVNVCSRPKLNSSARYMHGSEEVQYRNTRTKYSVSATQSLLLNEALNSTEADELVLKSWKSQATENGMSVLDDHEVLFPVVRIGSYSSQFVNVKNPSQQPVVMQLILNSGEIIDDCKSAEELLQPSFSSSLIGSRSTSPSRYGFSIAEGALTEAVVHPSGKASLGPIIFQPSNRCGWRSSVLIRNNLSGVEWLSLQGFGGSVSLVLLEESEPVQILEFRLGLSDSHTLPSPDSSHRMEVDVDACSQPSSKELYAKNMGDLPLEVKKIGVSGSECGFDGFVVQTCKGFALEPGESIKFTITYQTDFSAATVLRDLELTLATGILVIPMKASLSIYMLGFCKKSIFWMRVKKSIITILLVAFFLILVLCCFLPHVMSLGTRDYLLKSGKSSTARYAAKASHAHCSQKNYNKFPMSVKMNGLLRSIGEESLLLGSVDRYADGQTVVEEQGLSAKHVKSSLQFEKPTSCLLGNGKGPILSPPSMENSAAVESCDMQETGQGGNLTVKTEKDKRRRRRKKKSFGTGVSRPFEVSSSQSGNSTPSSPLSPASSFTPKRSLLLSSDVDQSVQARNPFSPVINQQYEGHAHSEPKSNANVLQPEIHLKPSDKKNWCWENSIQQKSTVLHKINGKPTLLPSATFPSAGRPDPLFSCSPTIMASASTIAPHAKAPGSKLHDEKAVEPEHKVVEEKFTYDIWGDHIFAPPLTGRSKAVSGMQPHVKENKSDSFFVRGPQALMTIAQSKSVSSLCCLTIRYGNIVEMILLGVNTTGIWI